MFKLRPYQEKTIQSVISDYQHNSNKVIISLATGLGKTVIFTSLAEKYFVKRGKVLVIAHRDKLLTQAIEKFRNVNPHLVCLLDQGYNSFNQNQYKQADVIAASVSTIGRKGTTRLDSYNPEDFSLIIIDEAHHALATTYVRILEYFGVSKHPPLKNKDGTLERLEDNDWNKGCLLMGATATPMRAKSGESLKFIFDKLSYKYDLIDGIKDGYLSNIRILAARTATDLTGVKTSGGDFQVSDLSNKVNTDGRNEFIVQTYMDKAQEGATIVFTVDTKHNYALKERFLAHGIKAEIVDGATPKTERDLIFQDFELGNLPVLINCAVLTEGFDAPSIKNVLMARPTKSPILYMQCIGRGTRLHEEKEYVTIIDFVDNASKHDLMSMKNILGIPEGDDGKSGKKKKSKKVEEIEDIKAELEQLDETGAGALEQLSMYEEIGDTNKYEVIDQGLIVNVTNYVKNNYISKSRFTWLKILEDTWFLPLPNYQEIVTKKGKIKFYQCRLKVKQLWEEWELSFEGITLSKQEINTVIGRYMDTEAVDNRVSALILQNSIESMFLVKGQRWHKDLSTKSQHKFIMNLLENYRGKREIDLGTNELSELSKGEAGILINVLRYETKQ